MFLVKRSLVGECCTLTSSHSILWNLETVHAFKDNIRGLKIVNNGHDTKPAYGVKSGTRSAERARNMGIRSSDPKFLLQ